MRRRRVHPAAMLAASGLALTACGGSGPSGLAPTTYAHRVCTAIGAFESSLTAQATAYQKVVVAANGVPAPLQRAAVAFLRQQVLTSATLLSGVQAVPPPAGKGGAAVRGALVGAAQSAHATFAAQQAAVGAADATNRTTFFAVLNTAQAQVQAVGTTLSQGIESVGKFGDQKLNDAFAGDDACQGL